MFDTCSVFDPKTDIAVICCSFGSSMSADGGIITSPLGPDKEIPDFGFAVTLFDGLKRHQRSATALVSHYHFTSRHVYINKVSP